MDENQKVNLTNGGMATVLLGVSGFVQEFANHPRVKFINSREVEVGNLENIFPVNSKVVVITKGTPAYHYTWATSFARKKGIPFLIRDSTAAVYELLKSFFKEEKPVTQEEVKETESKGRLNTLLQYIDWNKSNADNAREMLKKASELNIRTTFGSLAQFVATNRKKQGRGDIPKSARSQLDVSVEMLDKMIEDLTSMRDYLVKVTEENRILRNWKERAIKVMADG